MVPENQMNSLSSVNLNTYFIHFFQESPVYFVCSTGFGHKGEVRFLHLSFWVSCRKSVGSLLKAFWHVTKFITCSDFMMQAEMDPGSEGFVVQATPST